MTSPKAPFPLMCVAACLLAQACVEYTPETAYPPPPPTPPQYVEAPPAQPAAPPQALSGVDALVAPIALYPDPLIAIMLAASTVPWEITAASSYLVQYGDVSRIDGQPWDPSVRALAHYPTVVAWMAQNIAWTEALGSEFSVSPAGVMEAVQRLRSRALAAGTLVSTPQQQVFSEDGEVEILPAQADAVYIPVYDPNVVYADEPYTGYGGPFIYFGTPFFAGMWLDYSLDWRHHRVWSGDRDSWRDHGAWHPRHFDGDRAPPGAHQWNPRKGEPGNHQPGRGEHGTSAPVPRPMTGAPKPPPSRDRVTGTRPDRAPAPRRAPAPPMDRPRIGAPIAPSSPERPGKPASKPPAEAVPRSPEPQPKEAPPQSPTRTVHDAPFQQTRQANLPPGVGVRSTQPPATAPARAPAPAAHASSAPVSAPVSAPAPSSSSNLSTDPGNRQPQK